MRATTLLLPALNIEYVARDAPQISKLIFLASEYARQYAQVQGSIASVLELANNIYFEPVRAYIIN